MQRKGVVGVVGSKGAEGAEGVEPVEEQNAEELPKIVQNPKIAELCNVIACK